MYQVHSRPELDYVPEMVPLAYTYSTGNDYVNTFFITSNFLSLAIEVVSS